MVDINKLRGVLAEKGCSISELAMDIGINKGTLYRKLHNKNGETVTIKNADDIAKALNLSGKTACEIFFSQYVAYDANL